MCPPFYQFNQENPTVLCSSSNTFPRETQDLPDFSGDAEDWLLFYTSFTQSTAVYGYTNCWGLNGNGYRAVTFFVQCSLSLLMWSLMKDVLWLGLSKNAGKKIRTVFIGVGFLMCMQNCLDCELQGQRIWIYAYTYGKCMYSDVGTYIHMYVVRYVHGEHMYISINICVVMYVLRYGNGAWSRPGRAPGCSSLFRV